MSKGIGGHHRAFKGTKDEWLTPPEIVRSLGEFNLDPCAPVNRPWDTAHKHYTVEDDGLSREWFGRVWLNPPYGPETGRWMSRLAQHGNGIALIFARTETEMFFSHVWARAGACLFLRGRLHFHHATGLRADHNAGAPSVLAAYGRENVVCLKHCAINGQYVYLGGR